MLVWAAFRFLRLFVAQWTEHVASTHGCRRFESCRGDTARTSRDVARVVCRCAGESYFPSEDEVAGSNPAVREGEFAGVAQLAEHIPVLSST